MSRSTTVLVVMDGWGYREDPEDNAIAAAATPNWDRLWQSCPHTLIQGSGPHVGLPEGQMGNSEVGHMNLGTGRIIHQDFTRITRAIEDGEFFSNPTLTRALAAARARGGRLHVMGLLSPGGVHSHEDHIAAMIEMGSRAGLEVMVHAFLDGRDTPPRSAEPSLVRIQERASRAGGGIVSMCGRFHAMDRDQRWDRIEAAWRLLTRGEAAHSADDPVAALHAAYERGESDEFVAPTRIGPPGRHIADNDTVVFMNFRADRARQLSRAFTVADFDGFDRGHVPDLCEFVMLTEYAADIPAACAFRPEQHVNSLGEWLAARQRTQLRIAETEKYAHVTFFFSGGREQPFPGEQRELIPSPRVDTYDQQPEMSAIEVTDKLVAAIESGEFDVVICNYANPDMVGHTGVFDAAVRAVETIDACIGRVEDAVRRCGGQLLITADHGNVERMRDPATAQAHTAHTTEPVPLVYSGPAQIEFTGDGRLCDIAPTLLSLMGEPIPAEMTGRDLTGQTAPAPAARGSVAAS